jgi:hypothetical protein
MAQPPSDSCCRPHTSALPQVPDGWKVNKARISRLGGWKCQFKRRFVVDDFKYLHVGGWMAARAGVWREGLQPYSRTGRRWRARAGLLARAGIAAMMHPPTHHSTTPIQRSTPPSPLPHSPAPARPRRAAGGAEGGAEGGRGDPEQGPAGGAHQGRVMAPGPQPPRPLRGWPALAVRAGQPLSGRGGGRGWGAAGWWAWASWAPNAMIVETC